METTTTLDDLDDVPEGFCDTLLNRMADHSPSDHPTGILTTPDDALNELIPSKPTAGYVVRLQTAPDETILDNANTIIGLVQLEQMRALVSGGLSPTQANEALKANQAIRKAFKESEAPDPAAGLPRFRIIFSNAGRTVDIGGTVVPRERVIEGERVDELADE